MMKRLAATGMMTLCAGAVLMGATPAMAGDDEGNGSENTQILGIQTCREANVIALIPIHNLLGQSYKQGDCNNGSTLEDSGYKHGGDNGHEGHFHKHDHHGKHGKHGKHHWNHH